MELAALQRSLAWFHMLEVNQVNLYRTQSSLAKDEVTRRMFLKVAEIEARHIDNTLEALLSVGGSPSLFAQIAPMTGMGLGAITGLTLPMALKADIALENRAMEDYHSLICRCDVARVTDVLWSNYLDESLHTEWFKAKLAEDVDKLPAR